MQNVVGKDIQTIVDNDIRNGQIVKCYFLDTKQKKVRFDVKWSNNEIEKGINLNSQKSVYRLNKQTVLYGFNIKNVYLSSTMGLSFKISFKDI